MESRTQNTDHIFKLLVLGDGNSGKTSLIQRYIQGTFAINHMTTIGAEFESKTIELGDKSVQLQVWDTAGEERFRALTPSYYRHCDGFIIGFDLTYRESFERVSSWVNEIDNLTPCKKNKVIVGMKSDLQDKRQVSIIEAENLADSLGITYIETSSKQDINVTQVFVTLAGEILSGVAVDVDPDTQQQGIMLTGEPTNDYQPGICEC